MAEPIIAATDAAPDETPYDGEQLGSLIFDTRADYLGQSDGLWVYPASYDDLRLCLRRVTHLTECYSEREPVQFFALRIRPDYLEAGYSPAISAPGWYAATPAESTPELRRIIGRAFSRAAALRGPDGEVRP